VEPVVQTAAHVSFVVLSSTLTAIHGLTLGESELLINHWIIDAQRYR
jgi:hypothetical protein